MYNYTVDSYFQIGQVHLRTGVPCQDYADVNISEDRAQIVVSDGCSTAGKTDIGSRLAVRSRLYNPSADASIEHMIALKVMLSLDLRDLYSTCLYAYINKEGRGNINISGDGVVVFKCKNNKLIAFKYEWEDNRPYYTIYSCSKQLTESFIQDHGGDKYAFKFKKETWKYEDGTWGQDSYGWYTLDEGMTGVNIELSEELIEKEEIEYIALFTDGLVNFTDLSWKDACVDLLDFKSTAGVFLKRNMIFILREIQKEHMMKDDIAGAIIHIMRCEDECAG